MKTSTRRLSLIRFLRTVGALALGALSLALAAPPTPPDGFTLAVLPDTQYYSLKYPETYHSQTRWIAENAKTHRIAYVLHLGDITDKNTPPEWQVAAAAHARLAGLVPCALVPGNHDLPGGRKSGLSKHFPVAELKRLPTFGGSYDREPKRADNSYHLFTAGGRQWLILALEFGPRDDVVRWANEVVTRHPDRSVIMITHAYLRPDNTRFDHRVKIVVKGTETDKGLTKYAHAKDPAGFNDGEDLWQKLVSRHANFAFVLSGHTCVTARRTDLGLHGNPVHQILVDYQNQPNGGNGYLRLLQFSPDGRKLHVCDYSPTLDRISDLPGSTFDLDVPAPPRAVLR
jgi:predicted MPP superfamily phosphohydrolase